jgi:hypothetical protein
MFRGVLRMMRMRDAKLAVGDADRDRESGMLALDSGSGCACDADGSSVPGGLLASGGTLVSDVGGTWGSASGMSSLNRLGNRCSLLGLRSASDRWASHRSASELG